MARPILLSKMSYMLKFRLLVVLMIWFSWAPFSLQGWNSNFILDDWFYCWSAAGSTWRAVGLKNDGLPDVGLTGLSLGFCLSFIMLMAMWATRQESQHLRAASRVRCTPCADFFDLEALGEATICLRALRGEGTSKFYVLRA